MRRDRVRWGGVHFRAVIKSQGPGIIPNYYECDLWLILLENRRKIEPKEIPPTCCIYSATQNLSGNPAFTPRCDSVAKLCFGRMYHSILNNDSMSAHWI